MTSTEIEGNLSDLQERRASVEAERAEAEETVREARAALVSGETTSTDGVKAAQAELTALAETVEGMDAEAERLRTALKERRAEEEREEDIATLVDLADQAEEHRANFWGPFEELLEDFEERLGELDEAEKKWRGTFDKFARKARKVAPGVREGIAPIRDMEKHKERERKCEALVEELEERGADIDAAMPGHLIRLLPARIHFNIGEGRNADAPLKDAWAYSHVMKALRNFQNRPAS